MPSTAILLWLRADTVNLTSKPIGAQMCEVTAKTFPALFPEIRRRLQEARFVALDLEFSALNPLPEHSPSLFDSPQARYAKLRKQLECVVPLQVGLTAFTFDSQLNSYKGRVYSFHVQPAAFQGINRNFLLQTSALAFLKLHNFNFNKFAYDGVPFMNREQERGLRLLMAEGQVSEVSASCREEINRLVAEECPTVDAWHQQARPGDFLVLRNVPANEEVRFFVHRALRSRNVWTCVENGQFVVKKVASEDFEALKAAHCLHEDTVDTLLGFAKVVRLLASLRTPLVGHNLLQDLLLLVGCFEQPLPPSYGAFKILMADLFPVVFDTRLISSEIRRRVDHEKRWNDQNLQTIFAYFQGDNLAPNAPAIDLEGPQGGSGQFHDAAWDSYCTGYVFVQLAHFNLFQKYPPSKRFVSSELVGGLKPFQNLINLIRCSVLCINLAGADPESTRPPHLVIEALKNSPLSIPQVTELLSDFGYVEVRKLGRQRTKALIAVDNHTNAKRILKGFQRHPQYRIGHYVPWKHSPLVPPLLLGALTLSGALLLWQLLTTTNSPPVPA